jgi:hypothetical protein
MLYEWICPGCENVQTFTAPINIGPPSEMRCKQCGAIMNRQFCTNIVFKGDFPGKAIKLERSGENPDAIEILEKKSDEKRQEQAVQNEVLAERRKGRKSWKAYQKRHSAKVERYKKNLANGMEGK